MISCICIVNCLKKEATCKRISVVCHILYKKIRDIKNTLICSFVQRKYMKDGLGTKEIGYLPGAGGRG